MSLENAKPGDKVIIGDKIIAKVTRTTKTLVIVEYTIVSRDGRSVVERRINKNKPYLGDTWRTTPVKLATPEMIDDIMTARKKTKLITQIKNKVDEISPKLNPCELNDIMDFLERMEE